MIEPSSKSIPPGPPETSARSPLTKATSGTLEITAAFTNGGPIIGTEVLNNGTIVITAPPAALFNQYAAPIALAGSADPALVPLPAPLAPALAASHPA